MKFLLIFCLLFVVGCSPWTLSIQHMDAYYTDQDTVCNVLSSVIKVKMNNDTIAESVLFEPTVSKKCVDVVINKHKAILYSISEKRIRKEVIKEVENPRKIFYIPWLMGI